MLLCASLANHDHACVIQLRRALRHRAQDGQELLGNDQKFGFSVIEDVVKLARRIGDIHWHQHRAKAADGEPGDGKLRNVGHHHCHVAALAYAKLREAGRDAIDHRLHFTVGVRLATVNEAPCKLIGHLHCCLIEQCCRRRRQGFGFELPAALRRISAIACDAPVWLNRLLHQASPRKRALLP